MHWNKKNNEYKTKNENENTTNEYRMKLNQVLKVLPDFLVWFIQIKIQISTLLIFMTTSSMEKNL